jgi:hypothetical protein
MMEHLGSLGPLQAPVPQTWDIKGYSGPENALRSEPVAHTAFFKANLICLTFPLEKTCNWMKVTRARDMDCTQ